MTALQHWANKLPERRKLTAFLEWLQEQYPGANAPVTGRRPEGVEVQDLNIELLLDQYHEIDRKRLDEERRALLDEQRAANGDTG